MIAHALSDEEYENLKEKAFNDDGCMTAFIECNDMDFDEWCNDKGIDHDYACDHEMDYVESREEEYLEFAQKFYKSEKVG